MNSSPTFVAKTIIDFFCDLSTIPSATEKLSMLEDFTASLQQELSKIDPLQPELPFWMQLLNDAISTLKAALDRCRAHKSEAVLNKECDKNQDYELDNKNNEKERQYVDEKEKEDSVITSRALSSSPEKKNYRKLWKSWTPELHRKFLEALEVLGGSEVATPKQIRAVMKVDGLTNDEVKSYLQKYRLHRRRVPPANLSVEIPQSLWIYSNFSKDSSCDSDSGSSSSSGSGSPQGPFQLTTESGEGTSATNMEEDEDVKSELELEKQHSQNLARKDILNFSP